MSCKVGNKNHKERCTKYKTRGQREINKAKKAERNERRIARFAARRDKKHEEKYVPTGIKRDDGSNKTESLKDSAYTPKQKNMTEFAAWKSFMKRTQNQLDKEEMELKKAMEAATNNNNKKGRKRNEKKENASKE